MKVKLTVSLDAQGKYLVVDEKKVQMNRNADNPEWIIWTLDKNLENKGGLFNKLTDRNKPFVWNDPPPEGIFDTPFLNAKRLVLRLTDANPDETSVGGWSYRLFVSIGTAEYHTLETAAETNSPMIKNN
jgi:hypothetical protein